MGRTGALSHLIAARVRTAIDQSGTSWAQAADMTNIPRETLRRKLIDAHSFTIDDLEDVAVGLGLAPDHFIDSAVWTEASS